QSGSRKIANTNFTQRVGTVSSSDAETELPDLAPATLRTTFPPRFDLRVPRLFFDLRFVAAKVAGDYADFRGEKQDGTADYAHLNCRACASPASLGNPEGSRCSDRASVRRGPCRPRRACRCYSFRHP